MTNLISKKIDKIFSSELNHNRNLIFNKRKISNKSVKNKIKNNLNNNNNNIITMFNKRQSEKDENYKENNKFANGNEEIKKDKINTKIHSILKKIPDTEIKNYLDDDDSHINIKKMNINKIRNSSSCKKVNDASESYVKGGVVEELKKIKKTRFVLETKKEEKNNKIRLKRNRTHTKKSLKNIVMIEKQKYPKKETIFDRINRRINESKNNMDNFDNISTKRNKIKDNTIIKHKKILTKSIKISKCNINNSIKLNFPTINIKKISKREINPGEENNYNSNKTIKTLKLKKSIKLKINDTNINSENDAFQNSIFSDSNDSNENRLDKENIKSKYETKTYHSKKDINKIKNYIKISSINKDFKKYNSGKVPHILSLKDNNNLFDDKSINKSELTKRYSNSSSISNSIEFENNKNEKENNIKNFDNNNNADIEESLNKRNQKKYNSKIGGRLSVIPEQDNKKIFYEDIKENAEIIKPENIIMLEENYNNDKTRKRNVEIQKNNIIINNNVSNNITVHHKKELDDAKKDDDKNDEENSNKNKRDKKYVVKARKKFPFCCL